MSENVKNPAIAASRSVSKQTSGAFKLVCLSAALSFNFSTAAHAQNVSSLCLSLNAQFASLERPLNSDLGYAQKSEQYAAAIEKQQNQIRKAKRSARENGCNRALKRFTRQCRKIDKVINKMERNLRDLKRSHAEISPGGNNEYEKQALLEQMAQNGCPIPRGNDSDSLRKLQKKSRRVSLLEQIFGVKTYSENGSRRRGFGIKPDEKLGSRYGTYRTLCVRKSDGYYFPISFSTLPDRFSNDEALCSNMCPASEVALYIHRMPGQDSEDMVSYRTSVSYADEPFAFAYRENYNPDNKCRFSVSSEFAAFQGQSLELNNNQPKRIKKRNSVAIPTKRPDPAQIPDAYQNAQTGLGLEMVKEYLSSNDQREIQVANSEISNGKRIRIVGPAFFPVQ